MTISYHKIIIKLFLVLMLTNTGEAQNSIYPVIDFEPDTLFFPNITESDSILVLNHGEGILFIDSIKTAKQFGWETYVLAPVDTFWIQILFYVYHKDMYSHLPIKISPGDSALFVFLAPDLCPVCGLSSNARPFVDSLYFFSNDTLHNPYIIFAHGEGVPSNISNNQHNIVENFILEQNFPNPFNPLTTIRFKIPTVSSVQFSIFDLRGKFIRIVTEKMYSAGAHSVVWDGRNQNGQKVATGLYFYKMTAGETIISRKLSLLR